MEMCSPAFSEASKISLTLALLPKRPNWLRRKSMARLRGHLFKRVIGSPRLSEITIPVERDHDTRAISIWCLQSSFQALQAL